MDYKKGDIVELEIEKLEPKGKGISRSGGIVAFVHDTVPGEVVKAKITRVKKSFIEAEKVETIKKSEHEIEAKCPWVGKCGGCKYQNISYDMQLKWKKIHIEDCLIRIGGFKDVKVESIIKSPNQWYYRNKIELSMGAAEDGTPDIGFHKVKDYEKIVSIDECLIFDERLSSIIKALRKFIKENDITAFDLQSNPRGMLQYVVLRRSEYTGEIQVNFITRKGKFPDVEKLVTSLQAFIKDVSIFRTVNYGGVGYAHHGDKKLTKLYGNDYLVEKLDDFQFKITPFSFFQTNSSGAELLYQTVRDMAGLSGAEKVLDLYCGTGTIGQFLAKNAETVVGIELVNEAIEDAVANCELNKLENCHYIQGDTRKVLKFQRRDFEDTDIVITDPPRSGMVPKALKRMGEINAKKIVYVSCNPAMLARDLKELFQKHGYTIEKVQPVDMFPHTFHVETVVSLVKK